MSSLDVRLNMTMARLRIIEEALHGQHLWSMAFVNTEGCFHIPAETRVLDDGVQFVVRVPAHVPYTVVTLEMDGDAVQSVLDPRDWDRPHLYLWDLKVESPLAVG
jgi:hypothetical protein